MCGIGGICQPGRLFSEEKEVWGPVLEKMNQVQKHRGPDDEGTYLTRGCGLAHVRLKIIDLVTGHQPMVCQMGETSCAIVYNGEIYNMDELKRELELLGETFETTSDTEVLLKGYMREGISYIEKLNGIFAFGIWDGRKEKLILGRDRLGVKPLFYTMRGEMLYFSSEIKGLLACPGIEAALDERGLCELFALGPARTPGTAVFREIKEVLPGTWLSFDRRGVETKTYWQLESIPHRETFAETVDHTSWLIRDAVKRQMRSDIPISTFLSGGIDSSLVTAICAKELHSLGKQLNTFSFDFQGNSRHFKASSFQPGEDRPWVDKMVAALQTNHRYLECGNGEQYDHLFRAVDARDLPCMADVEASMHYFCGKVRDHNQVTLTGECADEIFGGYPWFHSQAAFESPHFPWTPDFKMRKAFLREELVQKLPLETYEMEACKETIRKTPKLSRENDTDSRRREIAYLNLRWFMAVLLERMDRTSMHSGLEARVPFADHRIVEYVWNVPWEMKNHGKITKALLRHSAKDLVPEEILWRRKSPYPKTYDPAYEALLLEKLREVVTDEGAPVRALIDQKKILAIKKGPSDYGKPWYGQLMAGPQMLAYLLQINYWLETYHIRIL